jgi:hypothetical protein
MLDWADEKAREWLCAMQDRTVQHSWKTEAARMRHRSTASPLFPAVYWSRAKEEPSLASLLRTTADEARAEERERCVGIVARICRG